MSQATGYTDTGLANGTTYYYEVSALNAGGQSTNSSQVSATPVGPPLVLSDALATGGQFTLQFNGADGQSYVVEMSTNLVDGNWTPVFTNTPEWRRVRFYQLRYDQCRQFLPCQLLNANVFITTPFIYKFLTE